MKVFVLLLGILFLLSCSNESNDNENESLLNRLNEKDRSTKTFETYFANMDSTKAGESIGCANGIYKLINNRYVLHITSDLPVQFDSCYSVSVGLNDRVNIELLVFDNKDASFASICTDLVNVNSPKPTQTWPAKSGLFVLGYSNPAVLHGIPMRQTSIYVNELIFIKPQTGEHIRIARELIWKVADLGTPG
ncbi:hypothetical protein [Fluviicola sp.]|uniref:hypothetical protein n=1 Tax=Fluviicola sp. TaxID=1917219 RepID=UPI002626661A|nr:hypothetical protein [Fluviicola sp.]